MNLDVRAVLLLGALEVLLGVAWKGQSKRHFAALDGARWASIQTGCRSLGVRAGVPACSRSSAIHCDDSLAVPSIGTRSFRVFMECVEVGKCSCCLQALLALPCPASQGPWS